MMGYNGGNWFGLGSIFYVVLWVLIIFGIFFALKRLLASKDTKHETKSAKDILAERYAKGEIDKKEFEEKKKDLA
ncbi:hypothetical protein A2W32_00225 [candidate division WWE3 bacterium RBG_16_37_10]|uniref:SHOCT domain-containing protein n=1 Tax=candidate division WWE3 bacterium RBG_16_37_10 TaxID=1802610 RepID=A0A1F4V3Y1_UNCKA|nr:MAG: hypothetical protein A2W32_00225 [candidate division WWE3 bacterium RBG_16_37_10]